MDQTFKKLLKLAWGDEWGHYRLIPRQKDLPAKSLQWAKAEHPIPTPPEGYDLYWSTASDNDEGVHKRPHRKHDHSHVRIIWVDIDNPDADVSKLPKPNFIINTSPGKAHFIYVLDSALPVTADSIAMVQALQSSLCALIGGDTASTDLGHVSRVPGTRNWKYDNVNVTIKEQWDVKPYRLADLNPDAIGPGEHRHELAKKELAKAVRHGEDPDAKMDQMEAMIFTEPLDEKERKDLVEWARQSDVAQLAPVVEYDTMPRWTGKGQAPADAYINAIETTGVQIRKDIMGGGLLVDGAPLSDEEFSLLYVSLHAKGYKVKETMIQALRSIAASQDPYSRILGWIEGVKYDGKDHIANLAEYFEEDEGVFGLYLRRWLVGCIAKLLEPGGAFNRMLVLEGPQGIGKSEFVRWLVPLALEEYFSEDELDLTSTGRKDTLVQATRRWIWEVAELEGITTQTDVARLKSFLTTRKTHVRAPYDRFPLNEFLRASYVGTTNSVTGFLNDSTGNRRYMGVSVQSIDWRGYVKNVDVRQLWAQALFLYKNGEPWELTREESAQAEEYNQAFIFEDPLDDELLKMLELDEESWVTANQVYKAVNDPRHNLNDIGSALQRIGAIPTRVYVDGTRRRVWKGVRFKMGGSR